MRNKLLEEVIEQFPKFKSILETKEKCTCGGKKHKNQAIYEYCEDCGFGALIIYKNKEIVGVVPIDLPDKKSLLLNGKIM